MTDVQLGLQADQNPNEDPDWDPANPSDPGPDIEPQPDGDDPDDGDEDVPGAVEA